MNHDGVEDHPCSLGYSFSLFLIYISPPLLLLVEEGENRKKIDGEKEERTLNYCVREGAEVRNTQKGERPVGDIQGIGFSSRFSRGKHHSVTIVLPFESSSLR